MRWIAQEGDVEVVEERFWLHTRDAERGRGATDATEAAEEAAASGRSGTDIGDARSQVTAIPDRPAFVSITENNPISNGQRSYG